MFCPDPEGTLNTRTEGMMTDLYGRFTPAECEECTIDRTAGSKDQLRGCFIIVHPN